MDTMVLERPAAPAPTVTIVHPFGTIEVSEEAVMTFPQGGLFGFERTTRYALLPAQRRGLWWMMSPTTPPVTFVLADPFVFHPDYALDLAESEKARLGIEQPTDAIALVVLTLPAEPTGQVTANLRAPVVFNITTRLAAQVVNRDESHGVQVPVDLAVFPPQADGVALG
jgi:flagellar assembly factor FliW